MHISPLSRSLARRAFTLMEILVVIAIITVLAAIAYPIVAKIRANANKTEAINRMKALASAVSNFASLNNGDLPDEDTKGKDSWAAASQPDADKAWYNALPRILGHKGVGDFVKENRTAAYYTTENLIYLPGAAYPESKKMTKPYFAIAINTKLHRKDKSGGEGKHGAKPDIKLGQIQNPTRTIIFLEQGMPGEPKAHDTIASKKDYDGGCKGSAKSFVARYTNHGIIAFVDGHCEEVTGKDLLDGIGQIQWDAQSASQGTLRYVWTADPKENPNKGGANAQ